MSTPRKISVICTWFPGEVGIARKLHRRRAVSGRFVQHLLIFGNDDRPADHDPADRLRPALHIPAPLHGVVVQRAGQNHSESGRLDPEDPGKFGLTSRNNSDKKRTCSRVQVVIHRQKLCTVLAEGKLPNTHKEALH